jgi:hypothetical protein
MPKQTQTVTIWGFGGGIEVTPRTTERPWEAASKLARELIYAGYSVKVNGLEVGMYYGPGYDTPMWLEGPDKGHALDEEPGSDRLQ